MIQDALGLTGAIREHVDRLASYGYLAVAPDLYTRGGMLRCVQATMRSLFSGQGQAYDDIEGSRRWLLARDDCSGRVGIIGFCMGGGFALMTANRGFDVSAPNYGHLPKNLDSALSGACPVVGSYGARDHMLKGTATTLAAALTERGIPHDVKEYPQAGHSFLEQFKVGPLAPVLRVGRPGLRGSQRRRRLAPDPRILRRASGRRGATQGRLMNSGRTAARGLDKGE